MSIGNIYAPPQSTPSLWDRRRVLLYDPGDIPAAGNTTLRLTTPAAALYVERVQRVCTISAGPSQSVELGRFYPGMRKTIVFPTPIDEIYIEWPSATDELQMVPRPGLSTSQSSFDIYDTPVLDLWLSSVPIYQDESYDPRRVIALVQPYHRWRDDDQMAAPGTGRALLRGGYGDSWLAVFRRATQPYRLSVNHVGGDRIAGATLWHDANSVLTAQLRRVEVQIVSFSAVAEVVIDLAVLTQTRPTGGGVISAVNTFGQSGSETECRFTPSGGITEPGLIYATILTNTGITGAANTANPPLIAPWLTLYDDSVPDAMAPPELRAGVARGWAIMTQSDVANTIRYIARVWFTEM